MPADNLFPITVRDVVRMGLLQPFKSYSRNNQQENKTVSEALEKTGIMELAERPYRLLSGGQKRRTLVARALAAKPQLLILDEPAANMDSESEFLLYETLGIYKNLMTILIVTHNMEFVSSLTDRVLCLGDNRKIVQHDMEKNDFSKLQHHGSIGLEYRVLHGENRPFDECCK